MKADLIITNIGQLVTCASGAKPKRGAEMLDVGIISNGAVAIANGKFAGVGTTQEIHSNFEADEIVDAEGRVVCPGFVDPHTHIVYSGDRLDEFELKIKGAEYLEILANGGGIISTVNKTRAASFEELVALGCKRLDKMFLCGTTTCEIKTGYGLDTEAEMKMVDVILELDRTNPIDIVPTFLPAHAVPPEFKGNSDGYVDLICEEMLPKAYDKLSACRTFFVDVFCEQNAFDLEQTRRIILTAQEIGFKIKAHVDQFTNLGGSKFALELGAQSIDHLDAISDEEIQKLAASDTIGIVLPIENFNAAKTTFANARGMIDAGCAIAISTDYNPGSAPCPSQPMAMAIACRYQKLLPAEALNAATINAAFGIGLGDTCGSIEVGKNADLLLIDHRDYRDIAYEFGGVLVNTLIKAGTLFSND